MKLPQCLVALTLVNLALLAFSLAKQGHGMAQEVAPVLRGRALEIVDNHGRVRAELRIFPRDPAVKMPDGTTGYPETALFRLINSNGGPNVKIAATEDGSAISLGGESNPTYISILARGESTSIRLTNKNGKRHLIKP